MVTLKTISETISSVFGILGILLFGYFLIMGSAHRAGRNRWLDWERARRLSAGKPNILLSSSGQKTEFPWKDPGLINAGLNAIALVAILSLYVVIMLFWLKTFDLMAIAILLLFPIVMVGVFYIPLLVVIYVKQSQLPFTNFIFLTAINLGCGILALLIGLGIITTTSDQLALYYQLGLLLVVSVSLSYVFGITDGLKDANLEERLPLVDVMTTKGKKTGLRLYEKTDTDYRFIDDEGMEYIIPNSVIIEITHRPAK